MRSTIQLAMLMPGARWSTRHLRERSRNFRMMRSMAWYLRTTVAAAAAAAVAR